MFTRIDQSQLDSRGATTLPDKPNIPAEDLKAEFDAPAKEVVAPAFNNLIDELAMTSATLNIGSIPLEDWDGISAKNLIDEICEAEITEDMIEELFES